MYMLHVGWLGFSIHNLVFIYLLLSLFVILNFVSVTCVIFKVLLLCCCYICHFSNEF